MHGYKWPINSTRTRTAELRQLLIRGQARVWTYIPTTACTLEANADHPICQTYIDTVLGGCLETGGEALATEFINTTQVSARTHAHKTAWEN